MLIARVRQLVPVHAHPVLMFTGVAAIAAAVTTSATVVRADAYLGGAVRAVADQISHHWGFAVSALAGTDVVLPLTFAAAAVLVALRHWRGAVALLLAVLATQAVVEVIKALVSRPRPAANGHIAEAGGFSFPSAHSATAMALYATLAFIVARYFRGGLRVGVAAAGVAIAVAVGASRILLAAHYPTDVLAGWLTGGALALASWLVVRRLAAALKTRLAY